MVAKRFMVLALAALMISFTPPVSADNSLQSANILAEGVSSSGYVCYDDGCSPNDEVDWWKVYAYKGDIVSISFSGNIPNPEFWCVDDGWEGDYSIHDSSGSQIASLSLNDDNPSGTLSKTMPSADWVYVKIKGKDSWCNDAIQYTLTASIDSGDRDTDEDGFIDTEDDCDNVPGTSLYDRKGCTDSDSDGYSNPEVGWGTNNGADAFANEPTQWQDTDNDGYGDNVDGFQGDFCPFKRGYSSIDRFGCLDNDGDGYSDADPGGLDGITEWFAHPVGLADAFPYDETQWTDTDGDGYGDNWEDGSWNQTHQAWGIGQWLINATQPDACPFITGTSSSDRFGCTDSDSDSYSDGDVNWTVDNGSDAFPTEPSQWNDRDHDGWGDNQTFGALFIDDFPDNPTQWRDTDKDGWGDNQTYGATQIDDFPLVESQYRDTDGDGYGDNLFGFEGDVCVYSTPEEVESGWISMFDRLGCRDVDKDGYSDSTTTWLASPGGSGDAWPEDSTQWHDRDGDGRGDNPLGTTADVCPDDAGTSVGPAKGGDRWGCIDTDGDGWSDLGDSFIHEPTQWRDSDGDGYGDAINGNQGDACPELRGTSILDRLGCRDTDGDGWSDPTDSWQAHPFGTADSFPNEALQWRDSDGDGFGDVALGSMRDDCPSESGDSVRDLQGCPDANGDGWSDDYGGLKAAIAILGEDPAASWLTYLVIGFGFIIGALLALLVKMSRDDDVLTEEEMFDSKQPADFETLTQDNMETNGMIPLDQLPPLPIPQQELEGGGINE